MARDLMISMRTCLVEIEVLKVLKRATTTTKQSTTMRETLFSHTELDASTKTTESSPCGDDHCFDRSMRKARGVLVSDAHRHTFR